MGTAEFAKRFVMTTKTWSYSTFSCGLVGKSEQERTAIVDRFFDSYESLVASEPGLHGMDYVHHYIAIEKIQS
jgi:hypothetical protein